MAMIPRTLNGLDPFECICALQKYIRRGMEREAMQVACEMIHSSKQFNSMLCNRLEVIAHEDIGLADESVVTFVATACEQARRHYPPKDGKIGKSRMMIGNAIRKMCRANKSREGDHFSGAIGLAHLAGQVPEIPDWVLDGHTKKGRKMGRGLTYFRDVSTVLVPEQKEKDEYEKEFYHWLARSRRFGSSEEPDD